MATVNIQIMEGRGSVVAYRNKSTNPNPIATIDPGNGTVPLTYDIGDTFEFDAYPDTTLGYSFRKYCDTVDCPTGILTATFTGTISQQTGNLYVYFIGTPATIFVNVAQGQGGVDVYRNTRKINTTPVSDITGQTFDFFINDTFEFRATPASGFAFDKYCKDDACAIKTILNPFTGDITSTGSLHTYFSSSSSSSLVVIGLAAAMGLLYFVMRKPKTP